LDAEAICHALTQGVPLLTATQRLAREWRRRHDDFQRAQSRSVWPSADVLPLGAWVGRLAEEALDSGALGLGEEEQSGAAAPIVLSEAQARVVWERIVAGSPFVRGLMRTERLAATAREAWNRLAQWRLPVPRAEPIQPLEQRAFAEWGASYADECARRGWGDPVHVADGVAAALRSGLLAAPPWVLVAGFDELPPQTKALFDALRAAGTVVESVQPPACGEAAARVAAQDAEGEAWLAARWARHWLEREPEARIGIVVPQLTERRAQLVRVLEDVLQPQAVLPGVTATRPFNVSQGLPLADYPLVATALRLLRLTPAPQPLEDWSAVLRSPFLAGAEGEHEARARLDVHVRGWGAAELTSASLQAAAGDERPALQTPRLAQALARWRHAADALPTRQTPSAWALAFDGLLRALGWPGERTPDSAEYQVLEKWRGLLEELARLELVAPTLTRGEALAALRRAATETPFQPEGADAPVQVLGTLESGGLEFDHLWVLGLHEELWPPPARPNPFLSTELQRHHGMPHASLARELELARRETERLRQAAPDVVFSYPAMEGDRPLRPSPLLRDLPLLPGEGLPGSDAPTLRAVLGVAGGLEQLLDEQAPPIAAGTMVLGGTGLFQDQAACPFRAFAHHRLRARAPEAPQPGLDAATRGTLVHAALERAWRALGDHAALSALDERGVEAVLAKAVEGALAEFAERHRERLGPRLRALEQRRLQALLGEWLALERTRTPFAVAEVEQRQPLEIGGISVTGRMDRIDRLPDGSRLLIDYKTGRSARPSAWWGDRPDEPQLPLYASSAGGALAGVAFAQVRRDALGFRGVADDAARFPGAQRFDRIKPPPGEAPFESFAAVVERWRGALEGLAQRFRTGDARVDPKRGDTCTFCDLPGLCRIAELQPGHALAAEADNAADATVSEGETGHGDA